MKNTKRALKEILLIELDDLIEDIKQLIEVCAERHRKEEITHYVHLENTAFFHNEMLGIRGFAEDLKRFDPDMANGVEEMAETLKGMLHDRVHGHNIAPALIPLVERKIEKVLNYFRTRSL